MFTRGLYAIVDPAATGGRDPLRVTEAILRGGCARLQLRAKSLGDREHLGLARAIRARCRAAGVSFVMNDRADLAVLAGADGLHLGQDDLDVAEARRLVGAMEIGRSTHDEAQARRAVEDGADLVAVGPIFPTRSKARPDPVVGMDRLRALCGATPVPIVAIGGIDIETAPDVARAGAGFGAAIASVAGADDPEAAARAMHRALSGEGPR